MDCTTIVSPGEALAHGDFDFFVKLPKTIRGNDCIRVFDNKLIKMLHFVAC
jgi:hypothetical protein